MSSFHNIRLPSSLARYLQGGPVFNTLIATASSGYELRKLERQIPIYCYKASNCLLNKEEYEEIISFFNARRGKAYSFRLKDYFDYEVYNQVIGIGGGDNNSKKYQLIKQYIDPVNSFSRVISLPVKDTIKVITHSGDEIKINSNHDNGEITIEESIKEGEFLVASFQFDVKVRFNNDFLNFRISEEGYIILDEVSLIEVVA